MFKNRNLYRKMFSSILAVIVIGVFSTVVKAGGDEESLYTRLGGTYNTVSYTHLTLPTNREV